MENPGHPWFHKVPISDIELRAGKVNVFWDLVDFPVPEGRGMREMIDSVLKRAGYNGEVSITAYGETAEDNLNLDDSRITFVHTSGDKFWRLHSLLLDIGICAVENPEPHPVPPNMMVVAKNEEDTEFFHLLQNLPCSDFNVFLVVPDVCDSELVPLPEVKLVWRWKSVLEGGEPMPQTELRCIVAQGNHHWYVNGPDADE